MSAIAVIAAFWKLIAASMGLLPILDAVNDRTDGAAPDEFELLDEFELPDEFELGGVKRSEAAVEIKFELFELAAA